MMPALAESKMEKNYSAVDETTDVESQSVQGGRFRQRLPAVVLGFVGLAGSVAWLGASASNKQQQGRARPTSIVQLDDSGEGDRAWKMGDPNWWNNKCPGDLNIEGDDMYNLVNAYYNRYPHEQTSGSYADTKTQTSVEVWQAGRVYTATSCTKGDEDFVYPSNGYSDVKYARHMLLGKTLSYTMNFNGIGCGWVASLSLNAMPDNEDPGGCTDYFCDTMQTCGTRCAEISLQEANKYAWFSTLHTESDGKGAGVGYGGGNDESPRRDWDSSKYGPNSTCINTDKPFQVSLSFPTDAMGNLQSMDVKLTQNGCSVEASIGEYPSRGGKDSMEEVSKALKKGMTLVMSLWGSPQNAWLDGEGWDKKGPCKPEDTNPVTDTLADQDRVMWANFTVTDCKAHHQKPATTTGAGEPAKEPATTADAGEPAETNETTKAP
jgi:hypothetical protein